MAAIINSGRNKIALQQSNSQPLNITKFVFANVPGLDPSAAVDLNQSMPAAEHIVYEKNKDAQGYVAPDQVVYSVILSPDVGDFYFNWIGLVDADNTLISVSYSPLQFKYKTVGLAVGNTLTRNFLTQYANAAEITGINVAAEAWQIDFMGRLDSADENMRADMHDFFGNGYFIGDGFKITTEGATVKAKAGYGYVGGYRVVLGADQVINTGPLPKAIWLKAHLNKGPSSSNVVATFFAVSTAEVLTNYTDAQNNKHFYVKLADVSAAYAVTEFRKFRNTADCLIKAIFDELDSKSNNGHVHTFDSIQGRPVSYPPSAHGHAWGEISGKPVSYPPTTHTHSANDITEGVFADARIPNTMSGKNFTGPLKTNSGFNADSAPGSERYNYWYTNGIPRWRMGVAGDAETGANAGATFALVSFNDEGQYNGTPLTVERKTNIATFGVTPKFPAAAKGDKSTNGASTAFVKESGHTYGNFFQIAANGTLDGTTFAGCAFLFNNNNAKATATINVNGLRVGDSFTFINPSSIAHAISTVAGHLIVYVSPYPNAASIDIYPGEKIELTYDGVNFLCTSWHQNYNLKLSGVCTATTAPPGTNNEQLATTAFIGITGLGLTASATINDCNLFVSNGWRTITGATINAPYLGFTGILFCSTRDNTRAVQNAMAANGTMEVRLFQRVQTGENTWSPWKEFALLDSPEFTGAPKAPTAPQNSNNTQISNTAYVYQAILSSKIQTLIWSGSSTAFDMDTLSGGHPGTGFYLVTVSGYSPSLIYLIKDSSASAVGYASTPDGSGINVITVAVDSSNTIRAFKSTTAGQSPYLAISAIYRIG